MSNRQVIDLTLDSSSDDDATLTPVSLMVKNGCNSMMFLLLASLKQCSAKSPKNCTRISHLLAGPSTEISRSSHELRQIEAGDDATLWWC